MITYEKHSPIGFNNIQIDLNDPFLVSKIIPPLDISKKRGIRFISLQPKSQLTFCVKTNSLHSVKFDWVNIKNSQLRNTRESEQTYLLFLFQ